MTWGNFLSFHLLGMSFLTAPKHANSSTSSHFDPRLLRFEPHTHTPTAYMAQQSKWDDGYWDRLDIQLFTPHHASSDRFFTLMTGFGRECQPPVRRG
ncbi:hypothetical protein AVEN_200261-1 [Araneus ventricosus]|uniref:Secreted protein n=1 Tax=Araneus ventricosus TaxID=182803 RepID=A0A4Y2DU18_ARAVE|nr:hypothetical protein AVEN_200261-1 [Araneus ventricosus]